MPYPYQKQPDPREMQRAAMTQQLMAPSGGLNEIMQTIQQLSQMQAQQQTQQQQAQKFPLEMQQEQAQLDNFVQTGKQSKKASKMERKKAKKELAAFDTNEERARQLHEIGLVDKATDVAKTKADTSKTNLEIDNLRANQPLMNQSLQNDVKAREFQKVTAMLETLSSIPATPETNAAIEKLRAHVNQLQTQQ